ncbi:putative Isotrichodermin C-15 hydroxylase [Glarea lozoyensis 74030]|uniref:Putative Isotrichodermin C-15 hydroxylase n=1 Tax=Glarea lozoyensis (strain ATCC 74030 / MF5533) TaxID=1104152 RepID=H0EHC0_GLAL7|nr:putative Isotrichodermin C-15 hydroxylase [Glarea lozoyensis 74030]
MAAFLSSMDTIQLCVSYYLCDAFRYRPDGVLFMTSTAYNQIYGAKKNNVKKSKFYKSFQRNKHFPNVLTTTDEAAHAKTRKVLNSVFSAETVQSAEAFIIKHVDRWCEIIGHSPLLGLFVWLKPLGLDVLLQATAPKSVKDYYKFLDSSVGERIKQEDIIASRKDGDSKDIRRDLFHSLYSSKDPETGAPSFSHAHLRSEASVLVVAGADTTAAAMSAILFYLTRNERAYKKVEEEVRSTFTSVDEIRSGAKLSSCRYLRACINESQRMSPSGLTEAPREVLKGGLEVDGTLLPAGTTVGCAAWALSHSEEAYDDPWVYRPERWIVDPATGVTTEDVARAGSLVHPFLIGPGNCVGQKVAMMELLIFVGRVVWRMDLKAGDGKEETYGGGQRNKGWGERYRGSFKVRDAYITLKDGPVLRVRERSL